MPLAVTCVCGVPLEIDDKFAGQTVNCPDCQRPVQVPKSDTFGRRTSGLALTSLILALMGAFTIIGTIAAVLTGALALRQVRKSQGRLAGRGFAIAGMVIGVVMTCGTLLAVSSFELFGWSSLLSDVNWAGKLEFGGPLEVVRPTEGFAVTRPSTSWGVYKPPPGRGGDFNFSTWDDLLLVLPSDNAVILCYAARVSPDSNISICRDRFLRDFRSMEKLGLFASAGRGSRGPSMVSLLETKSPAKKDEIDAVELLIDKSVDGDDKRFLVRLLKPATDDLMYVGIAGVRRSQFQRLESQFREALESFRVLSRVPRRER